MAATQELEGFGTFTERLPTRNWYEPQADVELWEPTFERAQAIDYARDLERATRHHQLVIDYARTVEEVTKYNRLLEEASRMSELANRRSLLEISFNATRRFADYILGREARTHEADIESSGAAEDLMAPIEGAIEASRFILQLEDNWDEDGSPGYAEDTWQRTTQFVLSVARGYFSVSDTRIEAPKITPGPDGSIDVRWKAEKRSLLINFPASIEEPVDFFGSDKGQDTIKGTVDLSSQNLWLLMWLMR